MTDNASSGSRILNYDNHPRDVPTVESTTAGFAGRSTPATQHTRTSTYQPSSGRNPYGLQQADHKLKRFLIAEELKLPTDKVPPFLELDTGLIRMDPNLINKFFTSTSNQNSGDAILTSERSNGRYGAVDRRPARGPTGHRASNLTEGWIGVPNPPKGENKSIVEKDITKALVPIINSVIAQCHKSETRVAVDRQRDPIPTRDGAMLEPDIFLWGKGSPAFPYVEGTPPPKKQTEKDQEDSSHTDVETPPIDWRWCVIPIEFKTDRERGGPNNKKAFVQLGTYVREVFTAQPNRRFVPPLVVTESAAEFLLWDRAGVVVSEAIDYHKRASLFCHLLATIVRWDDHELGFDPTVFYHGKDILPRIQTQEVERIGEGLSPHIQPREVVYIVEETLFRTYTLLGRGSTCWRVRKAVDDGKRYVILDGWVQDSKDVEHRVLRKIENIREAHSLAGIAPLVHTEEVMVPSKLGAGLHRDTVEYNRRGLFCNVNLVHTRTVQQCNGVRLEDFASVKELLCALLDVIQVHGELYRKAKIVHRDIVPWNILVQRGAPEGSRGILIDFSCATSTDPADIVPRPDPTPGSHPFRCHNALLGKVADSHLDELESFYWIFIFICCRHTGVDLASSRQEVISLPLGALDNSDDFSAATNKYGHLFLQEEIPTQAWFGKPVARLVKNLRHFFRDRIKDEQKAEETGDACPVNPEKDYRTFLDLISRAIRDLEPPYVLTNEYAIDLGSGEEEGEGEGDEGGRHGSHPTAKRDRGSPDELALLHEDQRAKRVRIGTADDIVGEQVVEIIDYTHRVGDLVLGVSSCV